MPKVEIVAEMKARVVVDTRDDLDLTDEEWAGMDAAERRAYLDDYIAAAGLRPVLEVAESDNWIK